MNQLAVTGRQELLHSKLSMPDVARRIIERKQLRQQFDRAFEHKLILVTAPAGFGKTTAVVDWLAHTAVPCAWVGIDGRDNDPARFWRYVATALASIVAPGDDEDNEFWGADAIVRGGLLDRCYEYTQQAVLVLDDYHLINAVAIRQELVYLVQNLPDNFHLLLIARTELEPELVQLGVKEAVLKIDRDRLRFNTEEVARYYRQKNFQLSDAEVRTIEASTEGWAAGLVLAGLTMAEEADLHTAVKRFSAANRYVDRLFNVEIFGRWPAAIQDFLIATAFLDKLSGPLCDAVTGRNDSTELLQRLAESNSFIIPLDHENCWYRYHHLFGEFLRKRLKRQSDSLIQEQLRRAGNWYAAQGMAREAINYLIDSGAYEQALSMITEVFFEVTQSGEFATMQSWLDKIPETQLTGNIEHCTSYAWVLTMGNHLDRALAWIQKAETCFAARQADLNEEERRYFTADIALTKGGIAVYQVNPAEVARCLKEAGCSSSYSQIFLGELNLGEVSLLKTPLGFKGRLQKGEETYRGMMGAAGRNTVGYIASYADIFCAEWFYEQDQLDLAYQTLVNGMEAVITLEVSGLVVPCFITLAKIQRARGDFAAAHQTIAAGRERLAGWNQNFWQYFFDTFAARLSLDQNDVATAAQWLDRCRLHLFDSLSTGREFGYLFFARLLIAEERYADALLLLKRLDDFTAKEERRVSRIEVLCLLSTVYYLTQEPDLAVSTLEQALQLGIEDGYARSFIDELEPMTKLLEQYLKHNWKTKSTALHQYAQRLLRLTIENIQVVRGHSVGSDAGPLTQRETEIVSLIAAGLSNQEIAARLGLTLSTVKTHNLNIYGKLGVNRRVQAVAKARQLQLIKS